MFDTIAFATSGVIYASDFNTLQTDIQNEIYRAEDLVAGSFIIYRTNNYITGGSWCINGSNNSFSWQRDGNNYIESGTWVTEDLVGSIALYRDSDNYLISGNRTVS